MAAKPSRSRAFFLELVLDLVVFAICAIVSIQVFFEAEVLKERSSALSHLTLDAQVFAETFKASDGDATAMAKAFGQTQAVSMSESGGKTVFVSYYDSQFIPTRSSESARYRIECVIDASKDIKTAQITIIDRERELFTFEAKDYVPGSSARGGGP